MGSSSRRSLVLVLALSPLLASASERPVGFKRIDVPRAGEAPIQVGLWYPSAGAPVKQSLGLWSHEVVVDGPVSGAKVPVVILSHGASGSLASHVDLAVALARAGFLAAAVTHLGDNDRDQSLAGSRANLVQRPEVIRLVVDHLFHTWAGRGHLLAGEAGIFGFSLGAFTALVSIGGTPDLGEIPKLCATRASAPECAFVASHHGDQGGPETGAPPRWAHVPSFTAAVLAAPALGFTFTKAGLEPVRVPIQLWRAEKDADAPDEWNSGLIRARLPHPPEEHVVPAARHLSFLPPCRPEVASSVPAVCSDPPGFDRAAFHQVLVDQVVRFFRAHLGNPRSQ